MSTPDTEWEKAELAVFWDEIAQHLPKCMERNALGDEKIFQAFATAYPKMKKHLLTSRDTYWKERVRKTVGKIEESARTQDTSYEYGEGTYEGMMHSIFILKDITNEDNLK